MATWTLDDVHWDEFDPSLVDDDLLKVAKAAALTESNGDIYGAYLKRVFADDPSFHAKIEDWAHEEVQHGEALGRWAEIADPSFDYRETLKAFREGYTIDTEVDASVRGSQSSEMVARCIVEAGTSSFYSALKDQADEPVLKDICRRIAGDEFRHYKLFLETLEALLEREGAGVMRRLMVAIGRIRETEDDELAFAYHCANHPDRPYVRSEAYNEYAIRAFGSYRKHHAQRAANMVLKAAGFSPQSKMGDWAGQAMWFYMRGKIRSSTMAKSA